MTPHIFSLVFALFILGVFTNMYWDCKTMQLYCGWELMQELDIPISTLGDWYAQQTGDHSLCVGAANESEYCTCVFQCGNGVWQRDEKNGWRFEKGCNKYCHIGVCDGQD